MRIVVAGGSAAGIFTALSLARAGHDVVMLDRDEITPADDVTAAGASAFRAGAPQIVQPHGVLPLCRELLMTSLPDVYDDLLAAGLVEASLPTQMPPTLQDRRELPGDDRLVLLLGRRSTLDWVLRRAVFAETGVTVRPGERVTSLLATSGRPPRVTGVQTERGVVEADVVIDATGRRTPVDRWLDAIGAPPTSLRQDECGLAYYSRHFRVISDADRAVASTTRRLSLAASLTTGIWGGDNGTMVLVVAPLMEDKRFRNLTDPDVHAEVLRAEGFGDWLDKLEPISDIYAMAGLSNTLRRLVVDGSPVALGLHAVGDSLCTTNPTFGRGLSFAMRGALDLVAAMDECGDNISGLPMELDRRITAHIAPFYEDQAANDRARLDALRHAIFGTPRPAQTTEPARVSFTELRNAAMHDPVVFRAFWQVFGMLQDPEAVYCDPAVVERTRAVTAA